MIRACFPVKRLRFLCILVLLPAIILTGCAGLFSPSPGASSQAISSPVASQSPAAAPDTTTNAPIQAEIPDTTPNTTPLTSIDAEIPDTTPNTTPLTSIDAAISDMTLEEKVGQMMFPAFRTSASGEPLLIADEPTLKAIKQWKPGGVILFSSNLDTVTQTASFIRALQSSSDIPLFVGVDEEGGVVSRLAAAKNMGAVPMPQAALIGKTGDPSLAREAAEAMGTQLSVLGFNLDFAPVADINTNPENPVIGNRAYGTEPEPTARMVTSALLGLKDAGIISVIKHFPGHGDTLTDSHLGLAVVSHNRKRMDAVELVPFRAAIAAGVPVVMTAHVNTPGISDKALPVTLNPDILTGLLRDELKFDGVIITDAMEMGAITENYGESESIVLAVEAGADMLLVPVSLERACNAVLDAVKSGRIPESRLNDSVRRILLLKTENGLKKTSSEDSSPLPKQFSGVEAWRKLVSRIEAAAK